MTARISDMENGWKDGWIQRSLNKERFTENCWPGHKCLTHLTLLTQMLKLSRPAQNERANNNPELLVVYISIC